MSSIDLYDSSPDSYDALQHKRPDYVGAQQAFVDLATKYLKGKNDISVVDFCCGVGKDARLLSEHVSVGRAVLIDVNAEFLKLAKKQGIKATKLETIESDILRAHISADNDVVIS